MKPAVRFAVDSRVLIIEIFFAGFRSDPVLHCFHASRLKSHQSILHNSWIRPMISIPSFSVAKSLALITFFALSLTPSSAWQTAGSPRVMKFMDIIEMQSVSNASVSPNGKWVLYTRTTTDWKGAKRFSDVFLVSTERGIPSTRQMTFTKDKNETSPRWSPDGAFFVFLSNREASESRSTQNQLYMMRPDGGEARKIVDAKEGVNTFEFSKDGKWLVYSAGKEDERQIYALAVGKIESEKPIQLTKRSAPITWWMISPDSRQIFFLSPDSVDKSNKERKEKKFDARLRNEDSPVALLWSVDFDSIKETKLVDTQEYSINGVTLSKDGKWLGYRGIMNDRYKKNITEASIYGDLYLLELATRHIERVTENAEIGESSLQFSPDNKLVAFTADDDFTFFREEKIYVRRINDRGGTWKKLGSEHDQSLSISFWSEDGKDIYFNGGWNATVQLFAVSTETGKVRQLTNVQGVAFTNYDDATKVVLVNYSDPTTPSNIYIVPSLKQIGNRAQWKQLTDSNPQVREMALGKTEAVRWKSSDGTMVEGVLVYPVGYEKGKRYPLVIQIHGGPAAASLLSFNASYGTYVHVYAAAGYFCLLPNYRGSTNYGEKFKMEIGGDYFRQAYDDIMLGADHLINGGMVDADRMGVMGWSAGGHWSNWILTHTDRFKAISSGAGAVNWTSMYAQSDIQRNREFYFGGKPYDNFEHYWDVSPLKYIKNAKTPTLIHVVDGDPRVPRPQSDELHMALVKLGVPTEYFVYPGNTHGITEMRNQLVKMVSEFNWMEKWINGKDRWLDWKELLSTLKDENDEGKKPSSTKSEETQ